MNQKVENALGGHEDKCQCSSLPLFPWGMTDAREAGIYAEKLMTEHKTSMVFVDGKQTHWECDSCKE